MHDDTASAEAQSGTFWGDVESPIPPAVVTRTPGSTQPCDRVGCCRRSRYVNTCGEFSTPFCATHWAEMAWGTVF